ncbi:hypothetical protein IFM89_021139 [Coptis chinensis]|uniref:Uncharacterized protein n=1 Tax=Coptis chinensis TaxID=261450 RepID=A0A835I2P3_9MAGN|nr:hypothetical protein IFM89_021139 [Coptis chinensis]
MKNFNSCFSEPCTVIGDFNHVLFSHERSGCTLVHPRETMGFSYCLNFTGLLDLKFSGSFFTWSNNVDGIHRKMSKIDRCLVNATWTSSFLSEAIFSPPGVSNHSPISIIWHASKKSHMPFRFCNIWFLHPEIQSFLQHTWSVNIVGNHVYVLNAKLRMLKKAIRGWSRGKFSNFAAN